MKKDANHFAFHTNTSSQPKYEPRCDSQNSNLNKNQQQTNMELNSSLLQWTEKTLGIKYRREEFYKESNHASSQRRVSKQYNDSLGKIDASIHDHTMEKKSHCDIAVDNIVTEKNARQYNAPVQNHSKERRNDSSVTEQPLEYAGSKISHQGIDALNQSQRNLLPIYDQVLVVDDISTAKNVVHLLTTKYKDLIHACDTEVSFMIILNGCSTLK